MLRLLNKKTLSFLLVGICLLAGGLYAQDTAVAAPAAGPDPLVQVDKLWILLAGAVVFFMQSGFLAVEVGCVRPKAANITALKNVGDWVVCAAIFFFIGWPIMFGGTMGGWFGFDTWMLEGDFSKGTSTLGPWIHYLFQLAFAGTAATIISGALAERTAFIPYLILTFVVSALIYPVVGHWVWGNSFFTGNSTLLTKMGFIDFAGSTVVHSVGGWVSLCAVYIIGARTGRFRANGEVVHWEGTGMVWSAMGVLFLWFGWWGFNGGSTLAMNGDVGVIINNTNIAASFGGIAAMIYCSMFENKAGISEKFLNGILGGLVAITANCHMVSPFSAIAIGASGGVLSVIAAKLLLKMKLDDPVGAIPVHLVCGVWGTICVALFGKEQFFLNGNTRLQQLGVQLAGITIVAIWCVVIATVVLYALKKWVGLRVSPVEELEGYDIGGVTKHQPVLSEAEAMKLFGGK